MKVGKLCEQAAAQLFNMNKPPESASPIIHTIGIFNVIQVLLALLAKHLLIILSVNFIPYSKLTYSINVSKDTSSSSSHSQEYTPQ